MGNEKQFESAIKTMRAKLDEALKREKDSEGNEDSVIWHMVANDYKMAIFALEKWVEYEDLEEQCVKENSWGLKMLLHKWKEFLDDIHELYECRKLEEQGKLLKLPCAVGDTVYRVHKGTDLSPDRVYECRVIGVKQEYNTLSVKLYANINEETYSIWIDGWFDRCQIGYEFFLTQEEAEIALGKMR